MRAAGIRNDRRRAEARFLAGVLSVLAVPYLLPASAQAPDTSDWTCQRCPFRSGYEAEYSAGASYVSDEAAHFGDATGYDEEGGYLNLDGAGRYISQEQRLRWRFEDLALDSRVMALEGGNPGQYDYSFEWSALPRRQFDTTTTVFAEEADALRLPSNWVRAGSTAGFTALDTNLFPRDIESDRETLTIGGRWLRAVGFDVFSNYRRTEREGVGIRGAAYYSNTSQLPQPFDYATDELDLGLRREGSRSSLALQYYGSFFENSSRVLRWDNPFTSTPGTEVGELARPPDSSFQQLLVSGNYRFSRYDGVLSFTASSGAMEQDEMFLAYTANPNILTQPLPRTSLDARVATTHVAVTGTLRPHRLLRLKAAYRYDDRDNETPVLEWNHIIADSLDAGSLESNSPYSFTRRRLSLSAAYDWRRDLRLSAGYDELAVDRDFQEVRSQDETTSWGELSWRPNGLIDLRGRLGTSKRDVDVYDAQLALELGQNPLMRKYQLAYRYREFAELTLSASLPELPVTVSGSFRSADDSYTKSELGLLSSDDERIAVDVTWAVTDMSSIYFTAAQNQIESVQAGSAQFAAPDWRARSVDEFDSVTAGYRAAALTEQLDLEIDYTYGRGRSEIDVDSAFPSLRSSLDVLRLRVGYQLSARFRGSLELRHQRFEAEDWSLQNVGVATVPNMLGLGARPYDYDVFWLGLGVSYALGGEAEAAQSATP